MKTLDETLHDIVTYIQRQPSPISFDAVHNFMEEARLSFGPGISPIEILEIEAFRSGLFDVDRQSRAIHRLDETSNGGQPYEHVQPAEMYAYK